MGQGSKMEVGKLISYSGVLVDVLSEDNDVTTLKQFLERLKALQSQSHADFNLLQSSIQEYQKKIDSCKQKIMDAKSELTAVTELDLLQKELENELQIERALRNELRVISNEFDDLEHQRVSIDERRHSLKKLEQDELRTQMKLSMYASVTSIIPKLDDESKISGHIVEKDKKEVEKFEFDPVKMSAFETCNSIWKMINL